MQEKQEQNKTKQNSIVLRNTVRPYNTKIIIKGKNY